MICPICNKSFDKMVWNKKFCSYGCAKKFHKLLKVKDIRTLNSVDRLIYLKLNGKSEN